MRFFTKSKQTTLGEFNPANTKNESYEVRNGKMGSIDTVSLMCKIAREESTNKEVRDFAIEILNHYGTSSHNHLDEAVAIGTYIRDHVRYVKDIDNVEMLTQPRLLMQRIEGGVARGDCDDMALLTATLLLSIGIVPYFKIVRWTETSGNFNHIYVMVYERNYQQKPVWVALDCIIKDKPIGTEMDYKSAEMIKV